MLQKLTFRPGVYEEGTDYSSEGRWVDSNLVRFRDGFPEKINGWEKAADESFYGTCRHMNLWSTLSGVIYVGMGTHLKFYAFDGGIFNDITPLRDTGTLGSDPFATTDTSSEVVVTDTAHGAIANDFVTFSGATATGGISADALNTEHQITEIVDSNSYKIVVSETATSTTSGGGSSVDYEYQINTGLDSTFYGSGWGAGSWGRGGWGSAADTSTEGQRLRLWSAHNYGEDLIFCPRDSKIYYWDSSAGGRASLISDISGANEVPVIAKEVTVSNERHVIAFACDPYGASGVQDRMFIRWSEKEDYLEWQSLPENSAGDLRIPLGSYFVTHAQTSQEILVWSDTALHSMRYVGEPFIYGIDVQAAKATVIGPKAKAVVNDTVYWMGNGRFFRYRGSVEPLRCSMLEAVFNNLNQSQRDKIYAGSNVTWNEVTWFYPSLDSNECDKYITYNYVDDIWYGGTLDRTAWMDRPDLTYPMATDPDGYLYYHDFGTDDGSDNPAAALDSYIESSFFELGQGDRYSFVSKLIPDVTFRGCDPDDDPYVTITITAADWPGDANSTDGTYSGTITRSSTASATVERYTNYVNLRLRGRALKFKIASDAVGMSWRLGTPRLKMRPSGRQ